MSGAPESLHERGRAAMLDGAEVLDRPPGPGSPRWGLSVIMRPDPTTEARLAEATDELAAIAGPGQWRTGSPGASHLTVRSVEAWRAVTGWEDLGVRRWADVMATAAGRCSPVTLDLVGLTLTPGGVLAQGSPRDGAADDLRETLLDQLLVAGLADYEGSYRGTVWWSSLLHLAAPMPSRAARGELIAYVEAHRETPLGTFRADRVDLVRYLHHPGSQTGDMQMGDTQMGEGGRTLPDTLAVAELSARGTHA